MFFHETLFPGSCDHAYLTDKVYFLTSIFFACQNLSLKDLRPVYEGNTCWYTVLSRNDISLEMRYAELTKHICFFKKSWFSLSKHDFFLLFVLPRNNMSLEIQIQGFDQHHRLSNKTLDQAGQNEILKDLR